MAASHYEPPTSRHLTFPLGSSNQYYSPSRNPLESDGEDVNIAADTDHEFGDQEEVESVMCPVMSPTASHLASPNTPALEKVAAMRSQPHGGLFDIPVSDEEEEVNNEHDSKTTDLLSETHPPATTSLKPESSPPISLRVIIDSSSSTHPPRSRPQDSRLPSPWSSETTERMLYKNKNDQSRQGRFRPSMNYLNHALGPTRHRSRSVGQDALKKLRGAFPSLSTTSQLIHSLPSGFWSFGEKNSPAASNQSSLSEIQSPASSPLNPASQRATCSTSPSTSLSTSTAGSPRIDAQNPTEHVKIVPSISRHSTTHSSGPRTLRRVTSDESLLYNSLSRASSLGNDEEFQHVREMVNMRLQAIRESLPNVPNLKIPSLPKFHAPSFITLPSRFNDSPVTMAPRPRSMTLEKDVNTTAFKPQTELDRILNDLTGDIVVMGGLRGSVLRSAKPPHHQLWAPVKVGLKMRKVNLEIGLDDEDEERVEDTVIPSGMLTHMGLVDMSRKLLKKLRHCENARTGKLRVWNYGYDWRLSPHILSRKLQEYLAKLPSNQPGTPPQSRGAMVIAHSMGGIITRHAVNQQPNLFSGVLYAGTPQRCINILGPLRNGDVIMLNEKLLSTSVNFSLRSYFVFLPEDGLCFVDKNTREEYPVDFYDPEAWVKGALSPCIAPVQPAYNNNNNINNRSRQNSSSSPLLSSFLPTSLRGRATSQADKRPATSSEPVSMSMPMLIPASSSPIENATRTRKRDSIVPPMYDGGDKVESDSDIDSGRVVCDAERQRNMEYLTRVLGRTRQFRSELAHSPHHHSLNAYPPFAVLYGKSTPTVYGAQVSCREAIPCADAYDDLLFRPGDGVVLAKEAMLPEGYGVVKGGRVRTERGHITMLADLDAVGKALGALVRGRRKGIGLGNERHGCM